MTHPEEADFILAHGTEALGQPDGTTMDQTLEQLKDLLTQCAELGGRPMVVANPDVVSTRVFFHRLLACPCFSST